MTIELWTLLIIAVALPVLAVVGAAFYGQQVGNAATLGNREGLPAAEDIAGRAKRAHLNLFENALSFAVVVLIAHQLGISNSWTVAGAYTFLIARAVHYAVYVAGITGIRTIAYHVGTIGTLLIASQLVF